MVLISVIVAVPAMRFTLLANLHLPALALFQTIRRFPEHARLVALALFVTERSRAE
jgi:hypothetical protein